MTGTDSECVSHRQSQWLKLGGTKCFCSYIFWSPRGGPLSQCERILDFLLVNVRLAGDSQWKLHFGDTYEYVSWLELTTNVQQCKQMGMQHLGIGDGQSMRIVMFTQVLSVRDWFQHTLLGNDKSFNT